MCDIFKILGNFWEFYGNFLGIFWEFFGNFLAIVWDFFGNFLGIFWEFFGNSVGILWELAESNMIFEYERSLCFCQDFGLRHKEGKFFKVS